MTTITPFTVIRRLVIYFTMAFSPLILALILNRWNHDAAALLGNVWLVCAVLVITQRRPPCHYGSYQAWYADRANWWKAFPST